MTVEFIGTIQISFLSICLRMVILLYHIVWRSGDK